MLRRILRRASRFARNIGRREPFLYKIVPLLAKHMGGAYPELLARQDYIAQVIRSEEERFGKTLDLGLERFAKVAKQAKEKNQKTLDGAEVFTLYDTYGFPVDLTADVARDGGLHVEGQKIARAARERMLESMREAFQRGELAAVGIAALSEP